MMQGIFEQEIRSGDWFHNLQNWLRNFFSFSMFYPVSTIYLFLRFATLFIVDCMQTDSVYSFYLTKCLIINLSIRLYHNAGPWYHVLLAFSLKTSNFYKIGRASNFCYRFTFGNQMIEEKTSTFHTFMENPCLTIVGPPRIWTFGNLHFLRIFRSRIGLENPNFYIHWYWCEILSEESLF